MNKIFKNPYINSIYAEVYIVIVVLIIHGLGTSNMSGNFLDPIAALSLLVLSAAIMGYLFLGQPLMLYMDGEKKQSINFFMRTVISFAVITIIAFIIVSRLLK